MICGMATLRGDVLHNIPFQKSRFKSRGFSCQIANHMWTQVPWMAMRLCISNPLRIIILNQTQKIEGYWDVHGT